MTKDDNADNPFIRFKNFIDNQVSLAFSSFRVLPSVLTGFAKDLSHTDARRDPRAAMTNVRRDIDTAKDGHQQMGGECSQNNSMPEVPSAVDIVDRLQDQAIASWTKFSPYSPENLDFLRPPKPCDAPRDVASFFTFRDAFDDLLLASSGQPLHDMRHWSSSKLEHQDDSSFARPRWQWNTGHQGLWDAFFPKSMFSRNAECIHQRILSEMGSLGYPRNEMDFYTRCLIRQAAMCDEEAVFRNFTRLSGHVDPFRWLGFDDEFAATLDHELNGMLSPWAQLVRSAEWDIAQEKEDTVRGGKSTSHNAHRRDTFAEPESDEDMYLAALAELPGKDKIEETGSKENNAIVTSVSAAEPRSGTSTETTEYPDGSKLVKTIERESHPGMSKVTTTTRMYDASGDLVQRSVTTSQSSSQSFGTAGSKDQQQRVGTVQKTDTTYTSTDHKESRDSPKHGWFWTR